MYNNHEILIYRLSCHVNFLFSSYFLSCGKYWNRIQNRWYDNSIFRQLAWIAKFRSKDYMIIFVVSKVWHLDRKYKKYDFIFFLHLLPFMICKIQRFFKRLKSRSHSLYDYQIAVLRDRFRWKWWFKTFEMKFELEKRIF